MLLLSMLKLGGDILFLMPLQHQYFLYPVDMRHEGWMDTQTGSVGTVDLVEISLLWVEFSTPSRVLNDRYQDF